jgi:hypothetical protein
MWSILDRDYRSWVDHLSGTSIVRAASLSAPVSYEEDELSAAAIDVSSFNVDGSRAVAEALEARGHWKASAALFRAISSPAHLEDAGRAAWSFGLAEDDASVLALAHSLWSEHDAWPPKLHGAYAIALARGDAHDDAGLALATARAGGLAPEASAQVEAQTAAAASEQHKAARLAERATDLEPESFIAWLVRGRVARRGNDRHEELESARQARAAAPWSVAALAAEALALGPRRGLHKTITTEEVDALLAVLAADANHAAARQRLWAATTGRRGGPLIGAGVLFGLAISFAFSDAPSIAFAAIPALGGVALIAWNRLVRRRTARARSWADYLARLRLVGTHRAGGRRVPQNLVVEARPPESVLGSPARCWCDSLQHVVGVAASTYVRMHLVDAHASPAPGVYLFACPHDRGAYAGIDGGVDPNESLAQLFSIDVSTLRWRDTDASTGMYL